MTTRCTGRRYGVRERIRPNFVFNLDFIVVTKENVSFIIQLIFGLVIKFLSMIIMYYFYNRLLSQSLFQWIF